ncbi:uncharacterized protein LOC129750705 [Uranotaenia lowii]|uniref:uncharacterized protein LOC129750705 n=1 Tax=Uranotaenia lowii TaxID=190385 RepID=UPI00247A1DB5|nr:uncharacterized protein LOC129750705 [Uranotaenia lowii]
MTTIEITEANFKEGNNTSHAITFEIDNVNNSSEDSQVTGQCAVDGEISPSSSAKVAEFQNRGTKRSGDSFILSNKKHAESDFKFRNFRISWNEMNSTLKHHLLDMETFRKEFPSTVMPHSLRMTKFLWCSLMHPLVEQVRAIDVNASASVMEDIAKEIIRAYPSLDLSDDDGFGAGQGWIYIKRKLITRSSYRKRIRESNQPTVSSKQNCKNRNVKAGTTEEYWKITSKECSPSMLSVLKQDNDCNITNEFLKVSQPYVRYIFDTSTNLNLTLNELPVLRRRKLLMFHFEESTGVDPECLQMYFNSKKHKIIEFSRTHRKYKLEENASDMDVFKFFAQFLGEDFNQLVIQNPIGTQLNDVIIPSSGPLLMAFDLDDSQMYYVFANQARLTEGTVDAKQAICDLVMVHYVHNFMYMKESSKFMEFIQQYFF